MVVPVVSFSLTDFNAAKIQKIPLQTTDNPHITFNNPTAGSGLRPLPTRTFKFSVALGWFASRNDHHSQTGNRATPTSRPLRFRATPLRPSPDTGGYDWCAHTCGERFGTNTVGGGVRRKTECKTYRICIPNFSFKCSSMVRPRWWRRTVPRKVGDLLIVKDGVNGRGLGTSPPTSRLTSCSSACTPASVA